MNRRDAEKLMRSWHLGQTSARYESSGGGAATIAHVPGDHGGVSYGEYQLSSNAGTLREYLDQSVYGPRFAGLAPGSPAFDALWRELAHSDLGFGPDQHRFIGRSHYDHQLQQLKARGLDLADRGPAVQDCIWSTAVQMRHLTPRVFERGLKEAFGSQVDAHKLSDRQIVEAVQDYKVRHNSELFSKSPTLWRGLLLRAHAERNELARLADADALAPHARTHAQTDHQSSRAHPAGGDAHPSQHHHPERLEPPRHGQAPGHAPQATRRDGAAELAQRQLAHLGYTGADGRLIDADGRIGRNTRHALEQYQRDHRLPVTGHLDTATRTRLEDDDRTMASSTHPAHALYRQSVDAMLALDRQRGVQSGPQTLALAGAAAAEAARSGMSRVDRIEVGKDGRHAQAVEFRLGVDSWVTNRTSDPIDVRRALQQPLDVSSRYAEQAIAARAGHQAPEQHPHTRRPSHAP
ncbi:VgrG-related protein [Lysobacter xanthus]